MASQPLPKGGLLCKGSVMINQYLGVASHRSVPGGIHIWSWHDRWTLGPPPKHVEVKSCFWILYREKTLQKMPGTRNIRKSFNGCFNSIGWSQNNLPGPHGHMDIAHISATGLCYLCCFLVISSRMGWKSPKIQSLKTASLRFQVGIFQKAALLPVPHEKWQPLIGNS